MAPIEPFLRSIFRHLAINKGRVPLSEGHLTGLYIGIFEIRAALDTGAFFYIYPPMFGYPLPFQYQLLEKDMGLFPNLGKDMTLLLLREPVESRSKNKGNDNPNRKQEFSIKTGFNFMMQDSDPPLLFPQKFRITPL